ncbi:MAG: hypothetical protein ACLPXZ_31125, partial [Mycobacterium sp.]
MTLVFESKLAPVMVTETPPIEGAVVMERPWMLGKPPAAAAPCEGETVNTAAAFTPLGLLSVSVTGPGVAVARTTRWTLTLVAVPPAFRVAVTDGEEELTTLTLPSWVPVMIASAVAPGNSELGFMALITAGSVSWTSCWISCCVAGRVV